MADTETSILAEENQPQETTVEEKTTENAAGNDEAIPDDTEMTMDPSESKAEEVNGEDVEMKEDQEKEDGAEGKDGDGDKKEQERRKFDPETEEEIRVNRSIIISAVSETVTIKPLTFEDISEDSTLYVLGKARDFNVDYKDKVGTVVARFEPNRDWRAKFVIRGIIKMMNCNPEITVECSPIFRELLDKEKEGKPLGLFETQMSEHNALYVGGVPQDTTEAQLMGFFPKSTKVHLPCHSNGAVRGWAVVEFETPEDAEESYTNQKSFEIGEETAKVVRLKLHEDFRRGRDGRKRKNKGRGRDNSQGKQSSDGNQQNLKRKGKHNHMPKDKKMRFQSGNRNSSPINNNNNNRSGRRARRRQNMQGNFRTTTKTSLLGMGPMMGGNMGGMGFGGMGSLMGSMSMGAMGSSMGMGMNAGNWSGRSRSRENRSFRRMMERMNRPGSRDRDDDDRGLQSELSDRLDKVVSNERPGKDGDEDMVAMLQSALQAAQRRLGDSKDKDGGSRDDSGSRDNKQSGSNKSQNRNQRQRWGQGSQNSYGGGGGYGRQGSSGYDSYNQYDSGNNMGGSYQTSGGGWGDNSGGYSSSAYGSYSTHDSYGGNSYNSYDSGMSRGNIWDNASRPSDSSLQGAFSNYQSGYNYKY